MKKILIAHDGSKYSNKALRKAAEIAVQFGASLFVLSVIPELHLAELSEIDRLRINDALLQKAEKGLKKARESLKKKAVPVKTMVKQGNAAEVILDTGRSMRVDLIVTGSHGRQGAERFLLGSVSSRVVEHANRPVLVVK